MVNIRKNGCLMTEDGKMVCEYCGKVKDESGVTFIIGAKRKKDAGWVMVYGTGKIACDECYPLQSKLAAEKIDLVVKEHNANVLKGE